MLRLAAYVLIALACYLTAFWRAERGIDIPRQPVTVSVLWSALVLLIAILAFLGLRKSQRSPVCGAVAIVIVLSCLVLAMIPTIQ